MRTVVIDSCAVDPFVDTPGAYEAARKAIEAGELDILYVPVTVREVSDTRIPPQRRDALLAALEGLRRPVLAAGYIMGTSRLGEGRLCSEDRAAAIRAMQVEGNGNNRDALVAITAQYEGCALLTDEHKLRGRAERQGIEVLNSEELLAEIGFAAAPERQDSASA